MPHRSLPGPHRPRRLALSPLAALLGLAAALSAQAQPFTRTINSLVEVRRGPPLFGFYNLPDTESLRITSNGELNAPTQSTGAAIGLGGTVLNEGKLRAGFGSETMGLGVGGLLTNAGGSLAGPTGLIEAVSLSVVAGGQIVNHGLLYTGSHTFPAGPNYPAGERVGFQYLGAALAETGFGIAEGARVENQSAGLWTSHANGTVLGDVLNYGVFRSEGATATLPQSPGNYFKVLRVGQDWSNAPIGRIENQGLMTLDEQTLLLNAGTVVNGVQFGLAGQMEMLRNGQLRNDAGALFVVGGKMTVSQYAPYDGGVRNQGNMLFQRGGELVNNGRVVNRFGGVITLAAAVPAAGGGTLYEAGRIVQSDTGTLENNGLIQVQGSFTGGFVDNTFGQVEVGPGGHLAVPAFFGGQVTNNGGHVEVGRDAMMAVEGFTQNAGRLTVNGTLDMGLGNELRILGGVLDGGGVLDRLTGAVTGGGTINGSVFVSGTGGGLLQQPPFCLANGWACFRPGNSPGAVQISGDLTLGDHAVLQLEIERDANGLLQWDTVLATNMRFGAGSVIELTLGDGVGATGQLPLDLLQCAQACTFEGSFAVLGGSGQFFADASGLHFSGVGAVPEPGTWALLAAGLLTLGRRARAMGHRRGD